MSWGSDRLAAITANFSSLHLHAQTNVYATSPIPTQRCGLVHCTNILQYNIKWQQEIAIMLIGYARVSTQEQVMLPTY